MGTKNNPGTYDCYANAEPDEPMFVLLGRDPFAPLLVKVWAEMRRRTGEDPMKCAEAEACAAEMLKWVVRLGKGDRALRSGDVLGEVIAAFTTSAKPDDVSYDGLDGPCVE